MQGANRRADEDTLNVRGTFNEQIRIPVLAIYFSLLYNNAMSFKNFKNKLESLLESKKTAKPEPVKKKPVRSSAAFKRFVAESSYFQKKI